MDILVCVKQVPHPDSAVGQSGWLEGQGGEFVMNRFDEFAVEEALLMREQIPETLIEVISVGPERAAAVIRRALGMGADHGVHIVTDQAGYLCPSTTAGWIAAYARRKQHDLILTGVMSSDDMHGQVGPLLAEMLQRPCATAVIARRFLPQTGRLYVEREIEGGLREALEMQLPAVLAVQSGINQPRYPVLSKMLRANQQPLERILADTLDEPAYQVAVLGTRIPCSTRAATVLQGSAQDKARQLIEILQRRSLLK